MIELSSEQKQLLETVRRFMEREVRPVARVLEHNDEYPHAIVEKMKELGMFGLTIPEEYGGLGIDVLTYALVVEEICRVWMSVSGVLNTHLLAAYVIRNYGTEAQKRRWLPRMATGEHRGALCLTEPGAGSDVAAIQTSAVRDGDHYVLNGTKMFITNGRYGTYLLTAAKTNKDAGHRGISAFLVEKGDPGIKVMRNIKKLGYKGIETVEIVFDNVRVPADNLIGDEGQGFAYIMSGLELGRVNIAARACGVARAALEDALRYAQQRRTFGKAIAEHQAIQLKLADMATKLEASRLLMLNAALKKQQGERADLEAGMAKLFATESCQEIVLESMRIHGGYGYTEEFDVERYYRDSPLMIIGEGTNEIQKLIIARNLLKKYAL